MRPCFRLVLMLLASAPALHAQAAVRATRSDGGRVLLFSDGTWRPDTARSSLTGEGGSFTRPAADSATLDLGHGAVLHYDPAKWQLGQASSPGRHQLEHVSGDGYAMSISERITMPLSSLKAIVLKNAQAAAPDAEITMDQARVVNGVPVTAMQLTGTAHGIPFRYFGYYYAGKAGTLQLITFTGASLFSEYEADFEELLNGLQISE